MLKRLVLLCCFAPLLITAAQAQSVLYDGSGGLKVSEYGGWTSFVPPPASETFLAGATLLNTTSANALQAGFSRLEVMNRAISFQLDFTLKLDTETHDGTNGANRSGVSVIALTSDLVGIELGFWSDRIWAQSGSSFTKAEEGLFDTTTALNSYRLQIGGSSYALYANGLGAPLVSGALRDYSSSPNPVYSTPNFIFLGDDTTSARGTFRTSRITLATAPEPGTWCLVGLGLFTLRLRARRH